MAKNTIHKQNIEGAISTVEVATPASQLSSNRNFKIFWAGQSLSALGDAFAVIAMPLLVLQATGSVAQMGFVTALFGIGQFIAGLFSGVIVDRVDRRQFMILCDLGRMLVYSLIPLGWWLVGPQIGLVYFVTLVGSILGMCFTVAQNTAIANLVDREQNTAAIGRLQTTAGIAFVAGPMLAGFISAQFSPVAAIGINALSFAASALSLSVIKLRRASAKKSEPELETHNIWQEWREGLSFLLHQPVLRSVTLLLIGYVFLTTAGLDLFIFHLKHDLGQDDNAVGIVFGLASVGSILGAVVVASLRRHFGFGVCWIGGVILESVALATIGITPAVIIVALLAMIFTFADIIKGVCSMSLRQQITPDHLLGRVTSVFLTLVTVPGPFGAALLTLLAEKIGASTTLLIAGSLGIALALVGCFTPARTRFPENQA